MGRLANLKKRFHTGLELLNLDEVYTERGKQVYEILDHKCVNIISKLHHIEGMFDLSNQPAEFSYAHFLAANPFEKFMAKRPLPVML